jgi:hypothetical protein
MEPEKAIYQACLLRFRPIMMTTMCALLGGLPLMLGSGAGSELRRPLGFAMVGGLLLSQMLTLFTTPVVYLYLDRGHFWYIKKKEARAKRKADKAQKAGKDEPDGAHAALHGKAAKDAGAGVDEARVGPEPEVKLLTAPDEKPLLPAPEEKPLLPAPAAEPEQAANK